MVQDLRYPNIQLLDGAGLISSTGTLPGDEYHMKLKEDYEPIQHPPRSLPLKLKLSNKEELQ